MAASRRRLTRTESRAVEFARRCRADPVFFSDHALGVHLWSMQREIARSVWKNKRTAVKACNGPGKTYSAAAIALAFLHLPDSRVITTATTWPQVRDQLWVEIARQHRRARYPLGGDLTTVRLDMGDGRFAAGLSTKPEHVESFGGHHSRNILFVIDEASGVPAPIYEAAEGSMNTPGARLLLIGNPLVPGGEFYNAFTTRRADYETYTISAFDTPNFTGEEVPPRVAEQLIDRSYVEEHEYWKGGPLWDARILGNFPSTTEDTVCSLLAVELAQKRELEPSKRPKLTRVGCDVARFGSDETVISTRLDQRIRIVKAYQGRDLMQTVGQIIDTAKKVERQTKRFPEIIVDDDGVGGGVTDRLREQGFEVVAFGASREPMEKTEYPNARSESWHSFAEQLPSFDLDADEQLAADLTAPRYKLDSQGRRVVEPKEQTKKRIGRSPDRADSVLLLAVAGSGEIELGPELWD